MWDERFSEPGYAYGTEPNDFLKERVADLKRGRCLCLAEGQGRNAVWLAQQGFDVTAMDQSPAGLEKARELAESRGVTIATQVGDLVDFDLGEGVWDSIVSIFVHLPHAKETLRDVNEGKYHHGRSAVVQFLAKKPGE
ncbi:MAG: class I SAM-dependent methyltransferase [Novosphingobium sp.]